MIHYRTTVWLQNYLLSTILISSYIATSMVYLWKHNLLAIYIQTHQFSLIHLTFHAPYSLLLISLALSFHLSHPHSFPIFFPLLLRLIYLIFLFLRLPSSSILPIFHFFPQLFLGKRRASMQELYWRACCSKVNYTESGCRYVRTYVRVLLVRAMPFVHVLTCPSY